MTAGNISAISRPTRSAASVNSVLAIPKRQFSCRSRTNARTTRMPVICSRSTRLTASMRVCMRRNPGTIFAMITPIERASAGTATTRIQDSRRSSRTAMKMPPTHMTGAITRMNALITISICTCCTSLVLRVINDGAPNCPTSRAENVPTWCSTAPRRSRPAAIATFAPRYTEPTEHVICTRLTASISIPVDQM